MQNILLRYDNGFSFTIVGRPILRVFIHGNKYFACLALSGVGMALNERL